MVVVVAAAAFHSVNEFVVAIVAVEIQFVNEFVAVAVVVLADLIGLVVVHKHSTMMELLL